MGRLTEAQQEQLALLVLVGATRNHPAFGEDFGEISYTVVNQLVRAGLVQKASLRRYGGIVGERRRIGYWPTDAGRRALEGPSDA